MPFARRVRARCGAALRVKAARGADKLLRGRARRPRHRVWLRGTHDAVASFRKKVSGDPTMALNWLDNKGCALEKQRFTWKELASKPISKLDDDAFTRVRIILMNGIETGVDALPSRSRSRCIGDASACRSRSSAASSSTRRRWSTGCSAPTTRRSRRRSRYEQVAIEVTAASRSIEPDPVPGAGLPLRAARGLRPPVPLLGAAGPARRQGREQHHAGLHGHPAGAADRRSNIARPSDDLREPYDREPRRR